MREESRRLVIALAVYLAFILLFGAANLLSLIGERNGTFEIMEPIAGVLLGFLAFPIFCIGLPLWLARRWNLEFFFWPRGKRWWWGVIVIVLYLVLTQQQSLEQIVNLGIPLPDFLIHFVSSALFHVSYYPLFAVFLMPVIRRRFGLAVSLVVTAALFALFHLLGFYYFPAGLTLRLQVLLFASFLVNLLLYLWTESIILVALVHTVGGSVGLAVNGTLFNQVDEMLVVTAIIMTGLFAYMIIHELRHRGRPYRAGWWLQTQIDDQIE
jgi:membrane protease YdiL (CAAX protease family)